LNKKKKEDKLRAQRRHQKKNQNTKLKFGSKTPRANKSNSTSQDDTLNESVYSVNSVVSLNETIVVLD
jgi:hypothetical protein